MSGATAETDTPPKGDEGALQTAFKKYCSTAVTPERARALLMRCSRARGEGIHPVSETCGPAAPVDGLEQAGLP